MRIADVSSSYTTIRQLQQLQNTQQVQQERLVTGRRVNHLEDSPSTAASVLQGRAARETLVQLRDNADRAAGIASAGIHALDYLKEVSKQAQAILDTSTLRGPAAAEQVDDMLRDAMSVANSHYNGDSIFGGSATGAPPFSIEEENGAIVYTGTGEGRQFDVSEGVSLSPYASEATNQGILDFLNGLVALRNALGAGDEAALGQVGTALKESEDALLEGESALGMKQFRIEILRSRDAAKYAALDGDEARSTTADQTETIVDLLNTQKAYQASLQSVGRIDDLSLLKFI